MLPPGDRLTHEVQKDRSGCVGAMVFFLILIVFGCVGLVGSNPDRPAGTQKERELDSALGLLPSLKTTNTAPPPTTPPTVPPVPETEPPVVVVPQQQSGGGGGGGGGSQQPQQPQAPPGEVCSPPSGSISVSGVGSFGGSGANFTAPGQIDVGFSGYPSCHSYTFSLTSSDGARASGCFQTGTGVRVGTTAGANVSISVSTKQGDC